MQINIDNEIISETYDKRALTVFSPLHISGVKKEARKSQKGYKYNIYIINFKSKANPEIKGLSVQMFKSEYDLKLKPLIPESKESPLINVSYNDEDKELIYIKVKK